MNPPPPPRLLPYFPISLHMYTPAY
jgi:hypothetical protein